MNIGLPLGEVPGDLPIPLAFGIQATYSAQRFRWYVPPDPSCTDCIAFHTADVFRPGFGVLHFGFIRQAYPLPDGTQESEVTLLEDGREYDAAQTYSAATGGIVPNLPRAYGMATPTAPNVDNAFTHLSFDSDAASLGSKALGLVNAHIPQGFGVIPTTYRVVMDKDKARVFAQVGVLQGYIPILWMDRFGHTVTLQWTRSTSSLPSGITAITSVVAMNNRGRGVEVRWADFAYPSASSIQDLARVDFLGMSGPSTLIQGYSGPAVNQPAAFVWSFPGATDGSYQALASATGGFLARPTKLQIGDSSSIPEPSWNNSGSAAAAQPASPAPAGKSVASQTWALTWDAAHSLPTSLATPSGVTSTFTYQDYAPPSGSATGIGVMGVSQVDEADGSGTTRRATWARLPAGTFPSTQVTLKDWWPSSGVSSRQKTNTYSAVTDLTTATDTPLSTVLGDAAGNALRTTTPSYVAAGTAGMDVAATSVLTTYASTVGHPDEKTLISYTNASNIQVQQTKSYAGVGSSLTQTGQLQNTFQLQNDMLAQDLLLNTSTTRYTAAGAANAPVTAQAWVYDSPAWGQIPLLQVVKQYAQTGAWQHGATYTYDTEGRPSANTMVDSQNSGSTTTTGAVVTLAYDSTSGALASGSTAFQQGTGTATLAQTQSGFDANGRPTSLMDARGVVTSLSYDTFGRTASKAAAGKPSLSFDWQGDLRKLTTTQAWTTGSQQTVDTYDGWGRLIQRSLPNGQVVKLSYDADGRKSQQVVTAAAPGAGGVYGTQTTSWTYDAVDRVVSETDPDGVTTTFSYAINGLNAVKTAINTATQLKLVETTDPFGQVVSRVVLDFQTNAYVVVKSSTFTYDGAGHLTQMVETDPGGVSQTRTFTYDANGRLTSKAEPETGTQTFSAFNALGQPTQIADGVRTRTMAYDGLGRLVSVSSGADSLGYTYTGAQLTSATSVSSGQSITQSFTYKPAANGALLASEATQTPDFSASLQYAYTADGRLQTLTYPSGRVVTYGYDSLGRVQTVSQTAPGGMTGGTVATVGYDPAWGLESSMQFASGATSVWTTQADGIHLNQWSIQLPNGTKLDGDRLYAYDSSKDNLSQAGEWNLTHDTRGRLTQASAPTLNSFAATYGYDAFDNNTSAALSGNTPPQAIGFGFSALPKNQTPATTTGGSATGWTYDAAGEAMNLGAGVGSTPQTGLVWDGLGRLSQVNTPGLTEVEGYAPSGMRVRRDESIAANSRRYAYTVGGLLLGEYVPGASSSWQWNRDVIYLGSQAIAEMDGNGLHELHSDHLGTPRVITTASGGTVIIQGRQNFGPYGELFPVMNSGYAPLTGYTGHVQTDPTGMIYMRGRFYTSIWHRFVNSDQGADPSTFNQMAYVGGSPMMAVDPSGNYAYAECVDGVRVITVLNDDGSIWGRSFDGPCPGGGGSPWLDPGTVPLSIPDGGGGGGVGLIPAQTPQKPKQPCTLMDTIRFNWPHGRGVSFSGQAAAGAGPGLGVEGQVSVVSFDNGGAAAYATAGVNVAVAGASATYGPGWTATNAQSATDLRGRSTSWSLNGGFGIAKFSINFSTSPEGIWTLTVSPPVPLVSGGPGGSATLATANTVATPSSAPPTVNPCH